MHYASVVGAFIVTAAASAHAADQAASEPTAGWNRKSLSSPCSNADALRMSPAAVAVLNRSAFTEATVTVDVEWVPPGVVGNIAVARSSGYPELDAVAIESYRNMKCSFPEPLTTTLLAQQSFTFKRNR